MVREYLDVPEDENFHYNIVLTIKIEGSPIHFYESKFGLLRILLTRLEF